MPMTTKSSKSKPEVAFSKCGSSNISAMDWDWKTANIH